MHHNVCMRDCYDTCALLTEFDGESIEVRPNPENAVTANFLCPKGYHLGAWFLSGERLKNPLVRSGQKPSSSFVETNWDNAIGIVAKRIREVIHKHGPRAVLLHYYYGDRGLLNANFPHRLFNYLNASIVEDVICDRNGEEALTEMYGDPQGMDPEALSGEKLIVYWGINAAWTNMHGFALAKRLGLEIWAVDVLRSETVRRADRGIVIRPESDVLLALGIAKVMVEEGMYDADFVEKHVVGFESFRDYLRGLSMEFISSETGIGEGEIRKIAEEYWEKRGVIHIGYGFQRTLNGGEAVKAIAILPALAGKMRGFIYSNRILPRNYVRGEFLRREKGHAITQLELADAIEDGRVKFVFIYGTNPLATLPNQRKLRDAILSSDVFIALHDVFLTDTALYSDVVLPANTFFERFDLADSYYHRYIAVNEKVTSLNGKSNVEVAKLLARALAQDNPYLYEDEESIAEHTLREIGLSLDELRRRKVIKVPLSTLKPTTESGKIEIRAPPRYERHEGQGLKLISATYLYTISSQYHNTMRREDTRIHLNPEDARERGIKEGDRVRVHNELGEITTEAHLSEDIPRGIALMYKAFWHSLTGRDVNFLVSDASCERYRGTTMHSTWVKVEKST